MVDLNLEVIQEKPNISQKLVGEIAECFSLFDKTRKGTILAAEVPIVLRSLGICVTQPQIKDIFES